MYIIIAPLKSLTTGLIWNWKKTAFVDQNLWFWNSHRSILEWVLESRFLAAITQFGRIIWMSNRSLVETSPFQNQVLQPQWQVLRHTSYSQETFGEIPKITHRKILFSKQESDLTINQWLYFSYSGKLISEHFNQHGLWGNFRQNSKQSFQKNIQDNFSTSPSEQIHCAENWSSFRIKHKNRGTSIVFI